MPPSPSPQEIKKGFATHGITMPVTDGMFEQFYKFYRFLNEYNKKYNLTRLTTFDEYVLKHFVDCAYVPQLTSIPSPMIDMGTGAGFPGVPLKILLPELRVILVEGVQKKVEYLKELRDHLGLKGLDIIGRNVDPKMMYPVNAVITRAVEDAGATLGNVINCVQSGGKVILMKTPGIEKEIDEAVQKYEGIYQLERDYDYSLGSTTHKRKLLIFQKLKRQ